MKPRELAGHINRADHCYVYVEFSGHEEGALFLEVSRRQAKEIVQSAYDDKIDEIAAHVDEDDDIEVYIGDPSDMPDAEDEPEETDEPEAATGTGK